VQGILWCMVRWKTSDMCVTDDVKRSSLYDEPFWIPQETFLKKFKITEANFTFPPVLVFGNEKSKSVQDKKLGNVDDNDLTYAVHKYLTSKIQIEDLVAIAKQVINFGPEDIMKINSMY